MCKRSQLRIQRSRWIRRAKRVTFHNSRPRGHLTSVWHSSLCSTPWSWRDDYIAHCIVASCISFLRIYSKTISALRCASMRWRASLLSAPLPNTTTRAEPQISHRVPILQLLVSNSAWSAPSIMVDLGMLFIWPEHPATVSSPCFRKRQLNSRSVTIITV